MNRKMLEKRGATLARKGHVVLLEGGRWQVISDSDPQKRYNVAGSRCDCPCFTEKGWNFCKHVAAVQLVKAGRAQAVTEEEIAKRKAPAKTGAKEGPNLSLVKSALQKNIRKGRAEAAVRCALTMIELKPVDFLRRLPLIILEDVILHPEYDRLVSLLETTTKFNPLGSEDIEFLVRVVWEVAHCQVRDAWCTVDRDGAVDERSISSAKGNLGGKAAALIDAILERKRRRGMKVDMEMLRQYAAEWSDRFWQDEGKWIKVLVDAYKVDPCPSAESFGKLRRSDIPVESVDFHCSPILSILAKKDYLRVLCQELFPGKKVKETLQNAMWMWRSSPNLKLDLATGKEFEMWVWDTDGESAQLYKRIAAIAKSESDNVSGWWISKKIS